MKIHIDDIPEGGMQVNADSGHAGWLKNAFIEVFGPDKIKPDDGGRLDIQLFRKDRDITLIGGLILKFHPSCDRCLAIFQKQQQIPIHQIMLPTHKKTGKKDDPEDDVDDEDIGFYTDGEVDLNGIVKEYILLTQQMVNLCTDTCKGLCQNCGKNLNNGPCRCKNRNKKASPFAVLKKIHA